MTTPPTPPPGDDPPTPPPPGDDPPTPPPPDDDPPAPPPGPGLRDRIRRARGRAGLLAGFVAGVAVAALAAVHLVPLLDRDDGPERGDLVILSGRDDGDGNQRQALVDQWNALHPDNPARIEEIAADADAQHSEMVARAQGGGAGVDIFNLDVTWTAEFASSDYIRPLPDTQDVAGFLPAPLATCRYRGKLWGLPFNTDAGLLYYRTPLVTAAPANWAQLVNTVQDVLSRSGPGPQPVAGWAGQLRDYEGLTVNALEAIWGAGGEVVDGHGEVVIDSPEAQTGLTRLAAGLRPGAPQVILPDSVRFDETATTQAFAGGKLLFMRNWPVAHRALDPADPAGGADGAAAVGFGVAKLPGPSVLGGQNLAVARQSRHPRAARALIEFLTGERSQQLLFERGGFAATREIVYRDATVVKLYRYAPTLLDAIRSAHSRPVTAHYAQFSETFRQVVLEALADGGQLRADAKPRLQRALQGYK
ncbi:extracellular solute-binding protein [Dactylosporangium siamense]|uniref:ABC transporter substrate-binding protein n=1 Tax=Dactylosporangium siamense TaxID=685454 RepID=A0A919PF71_9ACTN|nr:extracellular solute-binding protein [Dactylosporangium siamense]GIG42824.1 ABC transporter substrate-binding protein [Dactylosporangium siamense]